MNDIFHPYSEFHNFPWGMIEEINNDPDMWRFGKPTWHLRERSIQIVHHPDIDRTIDGPAIETWELPPAFISLIGNVKSHIRNESWREFRQDVRQRLGF